jgi:hypothetical protein
VKVWKCVAQQKHTGHNALVNDYQRRNSLQATLSSHHIRKCYINKMEGPCGPLPNTAPIATSRNPTISICVMWWEQSLNVGEVNSATVIKKGVTVAAKPISADHTCMLHEILSSHDHWSLPPMCGVRALWIYVTCFLPRFHVFL